MGRPFGVGELCAVLYGDVFDDLFFGADFLGGTAHDVLELIVVLIAVFALIFNILELQHLLRYQNRVRDTDQGRLR